MKVMLVVLLLAVAQVQACGNLFGGGDDTVIGYVEDKYVAPEFVGPQPHIVVNAQDYIVPWDFYRKVDVGDIVKREKGIWTIVKKYTP